MARQSYGNVSFEMGGEEEGMDIVEEFYSDDSRSEQQKHNVTYVQAIQKGLQQSVQALN